MVSLSTARSFGLVCLCALAACAREGRTSEPREPRDAGAHERDEPDAGKPYTEVRRAVAQLSPVAGAEIGEAGPVNGEARWRTTPTGVDLDVTFGGCSGLSAHPIEILAATDCSEESLRAPVWADGRGSGIPGALCTGTHSGRGVLGYARASERQDAWTIGGPEASDLIGHSVVVRHARTGEPEACGVIVREQDETKIELPDSDAAPRSEVRALLTGLCQFRLFPNTGPTCPDPASLVECADLHCDLGACLQTCQEYASCVDGTSEDVCTSAISCPQTPECARCQNDMVACMYSYCSEHVTCVPAITPDGPCSKLQGCCALQGNDADWCLMTFQSIAAFGGDANCIGSMHDWDVLAHLPVPCKFHQSPVQAPNAPDAVTSGERLKDRSAGTACTEDADCPGGQCHPAADPTDAEGRYCTRACDNSAQCGAGGLCTVLSGANEPKQCLGVCVDHGDCREGFFCGGGGRANRLSLPGTCRPKRAVNQLHDHIAGRACDGDAECSDGVCSSTNLLGTSYPGNYCSGRCYEDSQCGEAGVCWWPSGSAEPGHCLARCEPEAGCERTGYRCWELGDGIQTFHACYPGEKAIETTGDTCSDDASCGAPPARCARELPFEGLATNEVTTAPEGYCTQACALDDECGTGATCVNYGTSGGICLVNCSDASPCRDGYVCIAHLRDGDPEEKVCVPERPGT